MTEKKCKTCGEVKPLECYFRNKGNTDGRGGQCKQCRRQYTIENKHIYRNSHLIRKYGITWDDYRNMWITQEGSCAICRTYQLELKKPLHVDHDHTTGKVRGLLCCMCNQGLGLFKENEEVIDRAKQYLRLHKNSNN